MIHSILSKFTVNNRRMSPLFLDAIALNYRSDLDVLILRWPQPIYAFSVREVYNQVLELAQGANARYWLFDIRSRGPLSNEDYVWLREEFFPSLHSQFNNITHVAYLLTPTHAEDKSCLKAAEEARKKSWYGKEADFAGFISETEALAWLKTCQMVEVIR